MGAHAGDGRALSLCHLLRKPCVVLARRRVLPLCSAADSGIVRGVRTAAASCMPAEGERHTGGAMCGRGLHGDQEQDLISHRTAVHMM